MAYHGTRLFLVFLQELFFNSLLTLLVNHRERSLGDELTVSNSWEDDYSSSVHRAAGDQR